MPLLVYFLVVFSATLMIGRALKLGYPRSTTLAFTAAGNNFELAIAVAIGTFGVTSGQALASSRATAASSRGGSAAAPVSAAANRRMSSLISMRVRSGSSGIGVVAPFSPPVGPAHTSGP